jgi:Zn-dependent M16 (insulinase) family peptidase
MRLRSQFHEAGWAAEKMSGLSYLFFVRQLAQEVEHNWPAVLRKLEQVRQALVNQNNMLCNVTLDEAAWFDFRPRLMQFLDALPAHPVVPASWIPDQNPGFEGLTIPAQVNYVGKGSNLYGSGYQSSGSVSVIQKYVNTTWLHERVRVQGGAYGVWFLFDHRSGVLTLLSYRDPNLLGTLDNYDGTSGFLRDLDLSDEELTKSIIGAIGDMDAYQLPDAKGYTSMTRYLTGDTDEERQRRRDEILSAGVSDFRAFADVLQKANARGLVVAMGSKEAIAAANEERQGWLQVQEVL